MFIDLKVSHFTSSGNSFKGRNFSTQPKAHRYLVWERNVTIQVRPTGFLQTNPFRYIHHFDFPFPYWLRFQSYHQWRFSPFLPTLFPPRVTRKTPTIRPYKESNQWQESGDTFVKKTWHKLKFLCIKIREQKITTLSQSDLTSDLTPSR